MKPTSLERLKELAKLNMDENCFKTYLQLIKPNIQAMMKKYFGGWSEIESFATQIVMRVNVVYKTNTSVIFEKDDDRTKFTGLVDLKKYKKFEKLTFKKNIDYLLENNIIEKNTYELLDYIGKKRNSRVHALDAYFSDEDREWFENWSFNNF